MRIGVFHPALDMYGGSEVVAVATVNALAQSGYDVVLLTNHEISQKRIREMVGEPLSCEVRTIVSPALLKTRGVLHLYESAVRSLAFKLNCDLLVDTYSCYVFPWVDVVYMHFPFLNSYDFNPKFPYLKLPRFRHAIALPYAILEKNIGNYNGKLILANSYFTAREITKSLGADSKVLYPPIPNALFDHPPTNHNLNREDLVVTVARFGPGKRVEIVPEIAYLTNKNIRFVLIGLAHDMSIVSAIKERVKKLGLTKRVTIVTDASRDEIKSYLKKAKVYLHTTQMEHFGISIAEAMALGCLPVVHDSGGAPEFVPDEYRYKDTNNAANIIKHAISGWTPEKSATMVSAAERFSERNYAKRFIELFIEYCTLKRAR